MLGFEKYFSHAVNFNYYDHLSTYGSIFYMQQLLSL